MFYVHYSPQFDSFGTPTDRVFPSSHETFESLRSRIKQVRGLMMKSGGSYKVSYQRRGKPVFLCQSGTQITPGGYYLLEHRGARGACFTQPVYIERIASKSVVGVVPEKCWKLVDGKEVQSIEWRRKSMRPQYLRQSDWFKTLPEHKPQTWQAFVEQVQTA